MNIFSHVSGKRPPSSEFNLGHNRKFAFKAGRLMPTLCQEVLPSDRWNYAMSALVRLMPMQAPIMHMVDVYNYSFFVPARLTMKRNAFETFITGGVKGDGKDALGNTIQIPYFTVGFRADNQSAPGYIDRSALQSDGTSQSLADFLGVGMFANTTDSNSYTVKINAMPFIAFWKIWNQYFRDQNLHPDYEQLYPGIFDATGDITGAIYTAWVTNAANPLLAFNFWVLPQVCWEKDYFTSALPFAQRGAAVTTPLTGTGTVNYRKPAIVRNNAGAASNGNGLLGTSLSSSPLGRLEIDKAGQVGAGSAGYLDNIESVELNSGGFTINQLRLAITLQEWQEKMARGGARYIEQMKVMFGVTSSDARLQRPEFLGGGKIPVNISEVLQTSENGTTPLANMAGHGVAGGNVNSFSKFFEEHGFVISIMFLRPKTGYQQGMPRLFTKRFDKLDWPWPTFAHLGEQEVTNGELFYKGVAADYDTWGYQSRYAEMKFIPNTVHGEFKGSLDFWHWGSIYDDLPPLSKDFVECLPSERIFNVIDENLSNMYCIVNNKIKARRPLPYFGTPSL